MACSLSWLSSRCEGSVLVVGDVVAPLGLGSVLIGVKSVPEGEVGHEVVGGGAVPVPFVGRAPDGVAGADDDDVAAADLDEADAFGDVEGLADGVLVPGGAGAGREVDGARPASGSASVAGTMAVDVDVAGEPVGCGPLAVAGVWQISMGHLAFVFRG